MKNLKNYAIVGLALASVAALSSFSEKIYHFFSLNGDHEMIISFFLIGIILLLSVITFYAARMVKLPPFVIAIFFGLASKQLLLPITEERGLLGILVGLGAALILFSGGLETPLQNFKKLFYKILSLSFIGLFLTALLFSSAIYYLAAWLGQPISLTTAVLLGALLASTDPAAIIPMLKTLRFKNRSVKDIIVSESAVTDVTGTLLTIVFLSLIIKGIEYSSINNWYLSVFSWESAIVIGKEIIFGAIFGVLGYFILELLHRHKIKSKQEYEADSAYFIFVPIFVFAIAMSLGGSGYLAAFVIGLIFTVSESFKESENFFNFLIEAFLKPYIFIFLGALVDLRALLSYAGIGLLAAFIFMFIIRPIAVFVSIGFWTFLKNKDLSIKDLIFISFVRETGAIPAALLTTIISLGIKNSTGLVEIGMWVILVTLIVEPILTPWVAKKLEVAEPMAEKKDLELASNPIAVLVSRGESFLKRLPVVIEWVLANGNIRTITILLCLENKYSSTEEQRIKFLAEDSFSAINQELSTKSLHIDFNFVSRQGLLEDNVIALSHKYQKKTVIFVGKKILDYRLSQIKELGIPIMFLD